jgi:uncharacterized protein YkwD
VATIGTDTSNRAAVRSALVYGLRPAMLTPVGWTGSTSTCRAGAPSAKAQKATGTAINYFRAMSRLDPVTLNAAMSGQAQEAALMMHANYSLDHSPPRSWKCWTAVGATAAGQSNLYLFETGASAIEGYMRDPGSSNTSVGHRRWLMFPETTAMGSGSTESANALMVFGGIARPSTNLPPWVAWPTPGYFPTELEPAGRWSLSASDSATDFSKARVAVKTASGTSLKVKQHAVNNGYGSNTLVWQLSGLKLPTTTTASRLDVAVTGIEVGARVVSRRYSVVLFNADARLKNTKAPWLSGTPTVGHTLSMRAGSWSPAATSYRYAWFRGRKQIVGVSGAKYKLTKRDARQKISVRMIARRGGYANGLKSTPARAIRS